MSKISVIIPLYNKESAIENTVSSVLKQTYKNFELIISDDGSTDNSSSIIKRMALDDKRIKYFYKSNGGVSSARNYGLSKAVGDWVVFIDADDEMLPNNLEHLHSLVANYNVEIAAANVFLHNEKGLFENLNLRLDKNKIYSNIIP